MTTTSPSAREEIYRQLNILSVYKSKRRLERLLFIHFVNLQNSLDAILASDVDWNCRMISLMAHVCQLERVDPEDFWDLYKVRVEVNQDGKAAVASSMFCDELLPELIDVFGSDVVDIMGSLPYGPADDDVMAQAVMFDAATVTTIQKFTKDPSFCESMMSNYNSLMAELEEESPWEIEDADGDIEYSFALAMLSRAHGMPASWLRSMYPAIFPVMRISGSTEFLYRDGANRFADYVCDEMIAEACKLLGIKIFTCGDLLSREIDDALTEGW